MGESKFNWFAEFQTMWSTHDEWTQKRFSYIYKKVKSFSEHLSKECRRLIAIQSEKHRINQCHVTGPILYPPVNINQRFSDIFMGYRKGSVERNGLIHSLLTKLNTAERSHKRLEEHFGSCQKSMMEYFCENSN